jgi:hypothetical protein
MPDVLITDASENAPVTAEEQTVALEAIAESATEIARIEAERDVAISEIHAETNREDIESRERIAAEQTELTEWQRNIEAQMTALQTENTELRSILTKLTPAEQPQANQSETVEIEGSEAMPENQEVPAEQPRAKRKARFRWI